MIRNLLLLNGLKPVDVGFFIGCGVVIALIIAVYFLIPVFNKKQYKEQRENLKKREDAFKSNKQTTAVLEETAEEIPAVDDAVSETNANTVDESTIADEVIPATQANDVSVDTNSDEER